MAGTDLIKPDALNIAALDPKSESRELLKEALAGEALGLGDFERVKWPTGGATKFERTVLGNSEHVESIDGVIVMQGMSRAFWKDPNPVEGQNPDCKSPDGEWGYGEPGDELRSAEPPVGCKVCPMAQFGSSKNPNSPNAQACKLTRDLVFLPQGGGILPMLVSIPPGSLGEGKGYVVELAGFGIRFYTVLTRLSLVKATSKAGQAYSQARFQMLGRLDDDAIKAVVDYRETIKDAFARVAPAEQAEASKAA